MPERKNKKDRGRPMKNLYPPRADVTAEDIAQAMFSLPADHEWEYLESAPEYRCADCGREVHYPDTLYRDGRCADCHTTVTA